MPKTPKDPRYDVVHEMLRKKKITSIQEIFKHIPVSVVAKDLRKNNQVVHTMVYERPGKWKVEEIIKMAELFNYDSHKLMMLISKDITG